MLNNLIKLMFCLHFAIIFFYLVGENSLTPASYAQRLAWTGAYVNPFFEQHWGMFAPTPPNSNLRVFVQYQTGSKNQAQLSPWYNIYSPIIEQNHSSLFSLNQRLLKYFHGCTMDVYEARNEAVLKSAHEEVIDSLMTASFGYASLRGYARIVLSNLPNEGSPARPTQFRLKFVNEYFPTYERRHQDYSDPKNYEFSVIESSFHPL